MASALPAPNDDGTAAVAAAAGTTAGATSADPTTPAAPPPTFLSELRDGLAGRPRDYTRGNLHRGIALLAVPMVLEMAMESTFALCDTLFVSRLGDAAVATIGITESLVTIVYAVAFGLSMPVAAMVARRIGEGDQRAASVAAAQAVGIGLAVGIALGAPCAIFAPDLLHLMGASAEVIELGSTYARITLGGNVVIMLLFLQNAVFRGAGDAGLALKSLWLANAVNLVLDPCLIFGLGPFPELGVTGAAIATACGRSTGVLYQMGLLRRGVGRVRLDRDTFRLEPSAMLRLVRISIGGVGQLLIPTASWVVLMSIVTPFGDAAVAGYTIATRIIVFALLPAWGLTNAAATLVGQNLGAKAPQRAEQAVWWTGVYTMSFLLLVMAVFLIWAEPLVGLFLRAPEQQPDVLRTGVEALRVFSYGYPFYAWGMVLVQAFNGAGDTRTPTLVNAACYWAVEIPLAQALAVHLKWGPPGVFWSVCFAETLVAVVALALFRRGRWKKQQV